MKDVLTYKGFIGTVHFSAEDKVFHGKIEGIDDLVTFGGHSVEELKKAFHNEVDDYIALCKEMGKEPIRSYKPFYVFWLLLTIFILSLGLIAYLAMSPKPIPFLTPKTGPNPQSLIDTSPQQNANINAMEMSTWIAIFIVAFGILQILPILVAAQKARKKSLTQRIKREITFLCEMPMYLGLLGSLLGICLTQFITNTLSAPLAYITTIVGILLYLFAKFTIIVPLPEISTANMA